MASAMDGVVSPQTAIRIGQLGGVGVLNLEGLWTRYEDPSAPVIPELIPQRINEINDAGVTSCVSVTPQRTDAYAKYILQAAR